MQVCRLLWGGLTSMGLQPYVEDEADRLATVNTIKVCKQSWAMPRVQSTLCNKQRVQQHKLAIGLTLLSCEQLA